MRSDRWSSTRASATSTVCMNFLAMPTLKKVRSCLRFPISMMPRFSLKLTLARLRTGIESAGSGSARRPGSRCRPRRRASSRPARWSSRFAAMARSTSPSGLVGEPRRACRLGASRLAGLVASRLAALASRRAGGALAAVRRGGSRPDLASGAVAGARSARPRPSAAATGPARAAPAPRPRARRRVTMIEWGRPSGPAVAAQDLVGPRAARPLHGDLQELVLEPLLGEPRRP